MDEVRGYLLLKSLRAIEVGSPKEPGPTDPNRQRFHACVQRLLDGADARSFRPGEIDDRQD
jgi:hypothetical protein